MNRKTEKLNFRQCSKFLINFGINLFFFFSVVRAKQVVGKGVDEYPFFLWTLNRRNNAFIVGSQPASIRR